MKITVDKSLVLLIFFFLQTLRVGLGGDIPEVCSRRLVAVQGVRNSFCGRVGLDDVFSRGTLLLLLLLPYYLYCYNYSIYHSPYYYRIPADIHVRVVIFLFIVGQTEQSAI